MSLKNRRIPTKDVQHPDGEMISVRGLSLNDLAEIVSVHRESMVSIFGKVIEKGDKLSLGDAQALSSDLIMEFPTVAAHLIACVTGDSSAVDEAAELPAGVQLDIIATGAKLTFEGSGGLKNVVEIVTQLLQSANNSLAILNAKKI